MKNHRKLRGERVQEIWEAARIVFLEKGFTHSTMEAIINKTELSKGGFYHYYGSKKEILMDMMRQGNYMYMNFNPFMLKLEPTMTQKEKIEIALEGILEKCLVVTGDKKIYTMFVYESMNDAAVWAVYLELEDEFLTYFSKKLGIKGPAVLEDLVFISRTINALLFSQHISNEPEILNTKRIELSRMIRPSLERILEE